MPIINNMNPIKLNPWVKKIYCEGAVVYSSGNIVTYIVDPDHTYMEEVDEGESCLSPATFTPAKSGWEFVGWRLDTSASSSILDSLVMGDEPITLYAVFSQTITLSYNANGGSGSTAAQTGSKYYNNGTVANPSFSLRSNGFSRSNYNFSKWAMGSANGTQYAAGATVTLSANTTFYAVWTYVGSPFSIVNGWECKRTLGWTEISTDNMYSAGAINFTAGSMYPKVCGTQDDDGDGCSFVVKSDLIATNGNRTIMLIADVSNGGASATINGVTKDLSGSPTFDISNVSSIQITVSASAWPYSGGAYAEFQLIWLY